MKATVIRVANADYLFASLNDTGETVFCHVNQFEDCGPSDCAVGDVLDIGETEEGERGLKANDIRYVERPAGETVRGKVVEMMTEKGYGFCLPDGQTENCFFHRSATPLFNQLCEGDRVEGVILSSPRGPRLERIKKI